MRHLWLLVALGGSGCNQLLGIDELTKIDGGTADSSIDALHDAAIDAPGEECFGTLGSACFVPVVEGTVTLSGSIDTTSVTTEARCKTVMLANGIQACAIVGNSVTVGAMTVSGTRPLMIASATTIVVNGDVDLGSVNNTRLGPGANPTGQCPVAQAGQPAGSSGGGGGAGGAFGGPGGSGGSGPGGTPTGGAITAAAVGTGVHGGCPGGAGGTSGSDTGPAGFGGGAIYLVARTSITITRAIRASGGGGLGGSGDGAGGGGGGSGGMIVVEAPNITLSGTSAELAANGGGGGEASAEGSSTNGATGGQSTAYNTGGTGGAGGSGDGGNGGVGARQATAPGNGAVGVAGGGNNDGGGGGGGGGLGLIWHKGPLTGDLSKISPPAVPAP